jgi:hypothetical protein
MFAFCCCPQGRNVWFFTLLLCCTLTSPARSFGSPTIYVRQPYHVVLSVSPVYSERETKPFIKENSIPCASKQHELKDESLNNSTSIVLTIPVDRLSAYDGWAATVSRLRSRHILDVLSLVVFSIIMTLILISWEDLTCKFVLPSRHRTAISLYQPSSPYWGASTIHGMGFGHTERQILLAAEEQQSASANIDPLLLLPSYNEVMLRHRTETIPQWKRSSTPSTIGAAIHTITLGIQQLETLQNMANDYQWDEIRLKLHSSPISDLSTQSAILRQSSSELNDVVGFDWGSCAWRHCGAIADIQEALDELDQLLGVLEPYEATFCLDIVERSLRDMLAVVPWQYASDDDKAFYANLPPYLSKISAYNMDDIDSGSSRIDDAYFKALQELRID